MSKIVRISMKAKRVPPDSIELMLALQIFLLSRGREELARKVELSGLKSVSIGGVDGANIKIHPNGNIIVRIGESLPYSERLDIERLVKEFVPKYHLYGAAAAALNSAGVSYENLRVKESGGKVTVEVLA